VVACQVMGGFSRRPEVVLISRLVRCCTLYFWMASTRSRLAGVYCTSGEVEGEKRSQEEHKAMKDGAMGRRRRQEFLPTAGWCDRFDFLLAAVARVTD
jgi:hypothetical protein